MISEGSLETEKPTVFGVDQRIHGEKVWCEWRDSNSQGLPHWNLNPARLPISPHSQASSARIIPAKRWLADFERARVFEGRRQARMHVVRLL